MLGVSQHTAKSYLHSLFAKTDTRRQTELVKLVTGYSNALLS